MDQKRLAFRILASIYPDRRPSEIREIINEALSKKENKDDIELWMALTKEKTEKEEPKVVEHHYYHDHYWPTWTTTTNTLGSSETYKITCSSNNDTYSNTILGTETALVF